MKIVIHDRPGYAFAVQLSQALAQRGHSVYHLHDTRFQSPQGAFLETIAFGGGGHFKRLGLQLDRPFQKYNLLQRRFQERAYGRLVSRKLAELQPDVVMSANTPPDAQMPIFQHCRRHGIRFVSWVHDIHASAITAVLNRKLAGLGSLVGRYYEHLERQTIVGSDAVVVITHDFLSLTDRWDIPRAKVTVIPNWAPLADLPVRPRHNTWTASHNLDDYFCFLYAGTLGLKHNPALLLQLAQHFQDKATVRVVVASEGLGADWLREQKIRHQVDNLILLDFQPLDIFPDMLAGGDVLLGILTPEAGTYSVPSKVLSYLCAQRPVLLAVPQDNLAARIIADEQAGLVVAATQPDAFFAAAERLYTKPAWRAEFGRHGRAYAERSFDIEHICFQFERVLEGSDHAA